MGKRILIVNHNNENEGTYFRCLFIAKYLSKLNYRVTLTTLDNNRRLFRVNSKLDENVAILLLTSQHGLTSITELPFHIIRGLTNVYIALSEKYDLVYLFNVVSPTSGLTLVLLKLLSLIGIYKGKLLVDWDDWWGKGGLTTVNNKGWFIETLATKIEHYLPTIGDGITVVSETIRQYAINSGIDENKLYYLPNGCNVYHNLKDDKIFYRKKLNLPTTRTILCFVGRVPWTLNFLFKSLELVIKKCPQILIIIISPKENLSRFVQNKTRYPEKNYQLIGSQPHYTMEQYLIASDILLLPRIISEIEKANSPARLGDYIAAGRPIVTNSIGDEVEKVVTRYDAGLLAKPEDTRDYAEKIVYLINNPRLQKEIGKRNYKNAKEALSWESLILNFNSSIISKLI